MTTKIKKISILLFAILTAAGIMAMYIANNSAFASNTNTDNLKKYIGENRAKEIALKDAGVAEADTTYIYAHLDRDDRVIDYDVDFYYDGKEYEYEINAYTGAILEKSVERERAPEFVSQPPAVDAAPQVDTPPSNNGYYYDDDYYDDDWDDRYDDDWDDRYDDDDDWDDRYDDDWDDRYDDDDDWDDDWDD